MKNPLPTAAWLILLLALLLRVGYMVATPGLRLVHDARDYDRAAVVDRERRRLAYSRAPGRETAFRPPAYPVLLAGVYKVTGVEHGTEHERVVPARILGIVIGTLIVGDDLHGRAAAVGAQARSRCWRCRRGDLHPADPGRRLGDVGAVVRAAAAGRAGGGDPAPALDAPLALGGGRGRARGPHVLTRANALVLLLPLGLAVWTVRPRWSVRALAAPALLVDPRAGRRCRRGRSATRSCSTASSRSSTQLGSALAGTYNDQARPTGRTRPRGARSGTSRSTGRSYAHIKTMPEPEIEDILRARRRPTSASTPATWRRSRSGRRGGCRARGPGLVAPHGVDDQRHRGLGRTRA